MSVKRVAITVDYTVDAESGAVRLMRTASGMVLAEVFVGDRAEPAVAYEFDRYRMGTGIAETAINKAVNDGYFGEDAP